MNAVTKVVFALGMMLAGFLLFQVQPLMAKFILPWFGGSATTWTVCMLFFQLMLLLGYGYAHAVTAPFSIRRQAMLQIVVVVVALFFLPITPSETMKPPDSDNPTGRIMWLLAICVGAPYVVLSTTSPLLQRWLAHIDRDMLTSRFFALSNLGSFLGLLSYPFYFERIWSSPEQTRWWSWAFVGYAAVIVIAALFALSRPQDEKREVAAGLSGNESESPLRVAGWIFYSALGSVLLLATTNQISQWTAVVPFLWILPLSLYLLTFIIAFGHQELYNRIVFLGLFAVLTSLAFSATSPDSSSTLLVQLGLQSLLMFTGCMICHAEMVRLQPVSHRLARFYMMTALGGALGGALVTLIAPLFLPDYFEHQIAIALTGLAATALCLREQGLMRRALAGLFAALFVFGFVEGVLPLVAGESQIVDRIRNFYGVVKVIRDNVDDPAEASLVMVQAGIPQGSQYLRADRRQTPYCAFRPASGIGRALANVRKRREGSPDTPLRIGSVGLGVGVLAALGKSGDSIRVYELNPAVTQLTDRHFTFVRESKAKVEILHGDGRILLERELQANQPQKFDILVVDAFRGASPPLHLMTAEAFDIYLKHLAPDGILAINFELDTFDLAPLHRGLAQKFGLGVGWFETPDDGDDCDETVSWALYSRDAGFFAAPEVKKGLSPWRDALQTSILWTDATTNLMSVINWDKVLNATDE